MKIPKHSRLKYKLIAIVSGVSKKKTKLTITITLFTQFPTECHHRGHFRQDYVGHLLVRVEAQTGDQGPCGNHLHIHTSCCQSLRGGFRPFHKIGHRQEQQERHDGDDGEEVDVLQGALSLHHKLLTKHVTMRLRCDIRSHGAQKPWLAKRKEANATPATTGTSAAITSGFGTSPQNRTESRASRRSQAPWL
jgi:hypothetical protein